MIDGPEGGLWTAQRVIDQELHLSAPAGSAGTTVAMPVHVGTSGWQYRDWRGVLYPAGVPQRRWLEHYAEHFATVENNNAFYRLPARETFTDWHDRTPGDFVMAVKASRFLTHIKRLRDPAEPVARLLGAAAGLGDRLGPILLQLPPNLAAEPERLDACLREFGRPRGSGGVGRFGGSAGSGGARRPARPRSRACAHRLWSRSSRGTSPGGAARCGRCSRGTTRRWSGLTGSGIRSPRSGTRRAGVTCDFMRGRRAHGHVTGSER